jgi:hypothetical protein
MRLNDAMSQKAESSFFALFGMFVKITHNSVFSGDFVSPKQYFALYQYYTLIYDKQLRPVMTFKYRKRQNNDDKA